MKLLKLKCSVCVLYEQVIHRDLKPSNIMMSEDGTVKVIDLGLARQCRPHVDDLTEYVQTRWYRSPELLLGLQYGYEVDIWAIGCIAAEMVLGFPIFKGKSHIDQLQVILQCFGSLPRRFQHQLESMDRSGKLKIPSKGDVLGLAGWLPKSTPQDILSFITSCLELNPLVRPSAEDLLWLPQFTTTASQFTDRSCQTDHHPGTNKSSIPRSLHSKVSASLFAAGMHQLGGFDKKEIEGEEHDYSLHGNTSTASKSRVMDLSSESGVITAGGSGLGGQSTIRDSATCNHSSRRLMSKEGDGALLRPSVLAIDSTTTLSRHRSGCITSQEVQEESEISTDYNTVVAAGTMRRFVQQKAAAGAQQDSTVYDEKTKPSIKGGEDNGDAGSPPSSRPYQRAFQLSRSRSYADTLLLTLQMKAGRSKIIPHHQPLSTSITSSTGSMSPIPKSGIKTPGAPIPLRPHLHRNSKQASRAAHQDDEGSDEGQQAPGTAVAPSGDKYLRGRELHAASHLPLNIHHSSAGTPGLEPKGTVQHKQPDQAAGVLPLQLPHHSAVLQERQPQRRCASGPLELIHQPCSSIIKHAAVASHNHFDPSEMTCQQSSAAGGAGHYGHGFHHSQKTSSDSRKQSVDNEDAASRLKDHNYSSVVPLLYSSKAGQQPRGSGRTVSMELPAHSSSPSAAGILGVASVSALKIIKSRRSTGEDGRFVWASSRLSKSGNADVVSKYDGQSLNNTAIAVGTSTLTTYPVPSQLDLNAALSNHSSSLNTRDLAGPLSKPVVP
ncbi:hypothetical protein CEUSTIGMA_g10263.t1 [Chlamydomonas eustigma]|uniref:Protein kinase domain-containing protein n=1 Tax=Chlamydomonas eustigma TaxID=1157962 RepID=A0A250XIC0_9CHLO|nr:hypothetical protein CEUSTIGMA_g10263.t1 [Chlamydomonas eustigma]|eukprot:GAX82837.1 hypothetical protein CEUSTIGMA_g10263.t1 [Chlamydomonas eustigma]